MKQRCQNPNVAYYHCYGGRGITVSKEWQEFKNFYADMGPRPKGYQIDRIDNNKGYCKENCKWVSPKENILNKRYKKRALLPGVRKRVGRRYEAHITINKKQYRLGCFDSEIEAHDQFVKTFKEWHGKMPLAE